MIRSHDAEAERLRRREALLAELDRAFDPSGGPREVVRAPGRVNLIGEHTDYNEGWVLPAAIDLEAWIALERTAAGEVVLRSMQLGDERSFGLDGLTAARPEVGWIRYVAGVAWSMREDGVGVRGFRGVLDSTVPVGAGLSSSAAIGVAASVALRGAADAPPDPARTALLVQRSENRYVGVNSGVMDELASAAGRAGRAVLIDCRSLELGYVALPEHLSLVVCDTASPRRLEASAYNERRSECERGAALIAEREPGVRSLRDVDTALLRRHADRLPDAVARRCEHVVTENERVLEAVAALESDDSEALGRLFAASHASLRELFEVSSPELDALVEIAVSVPGVVAARMTGAGFGGCTVNLVERGAEDRLEAAIARRYPRLTGLTPRVYRVAAVDGAGPVAAARA